jgi:hypothetical protein
VALGSFRFGNVTGAPVESGKPLCASVRYATGLIGIRDEAGIGSGDGGVLIYREPWNRIIEGVAKIGIPRGAAIASPPACVQWREVAKAARIMLGP